MNEIDDYLRANRDRFTRQALTKTLVDAGHDPAAVEAAWSRLGSGPVDHWAPSTAPDEPPHGQAGVGTVLLVVLALLVYGGAILLAVAAISFGGGISVLMIVYVIAMLVGLVHSVRQLLSAPKRGLGTGPIWGAVGISVLIFIGLSGACLVAIGPVTNLTGTRVL
jgi:hypothetical protein